MGKRHTARAGPDSPSPMAKKGQSHTLAPPPIRIHEVSRSGLKLRLTLLTAKPKAYSRLQSPDAGNPSQSCRGPTRRLPKSVNQGLGSIDHRKPRLDILQPGVIGFGRIPTQGLLCILELHK